MLLYSGTNPSAGVVIFIHTCSYISVAVIKHNSQDNRQKEAFILAYGFRGLEFEMARQELRQAWQL